MIMIKDTHATYDGISLWDGEKIPAFKIEKETEEELEEAGVLLLEMLDMPDLFGDR